MELRKVKKKDVELLFNWANDSSVRKNAISSNSIEWENHTKWFNHKIKSNDSFIYILEEDQTPVGQIRFDKTDEGYLIDYSIDLVFRKKGYGTKIVKYGCDALKKEFHTVITILAEVKDINIGSSKIFLNLGFTLIKEQTISKQFFYTYKKVV